MNILYNIAYLILGEEKLTNLTIFVQKIYKQFSINFFWKEILSKLQNIFFILLFLVIYNLNTSLDIAHKRGSLGATAVYFITVLYSVSIVYVAFVNLGYYYLRIFVSKSESIRQLFTVKSVCFFIGFALFSLYILLLSAMNSINIYSVAGIIVAGILIEPICIKSTITSIYSRLSTIASPNLLLALLWMLLIFRAFLPYYDWDGMVYHIPALQDFVLQKSIGIYSQADPYNFPYSYGLSFIPFILLNLYESCALQALLIFYFATSFVRSLCLHERSGFKIYYFSILIIFAIPAFWSSAYKVQPETIIGATVIAVFVLIQFGHRTRDFQGTLPAICLLLGLVSGSKITGSCFVVVIILCILFDKLYRDAIFRLKKVELLVCILVLSVPSFFWYGKNYLYFGVPTYPKFSIRDSPSQDTSKLESKFVKSRAILKRNISQLNVVPPAPDISIKAETLRMINMININKSESKYNLLDLFFNQDIYVRKWIDRYNAIIIFGFIPFWLFTDKVLRIYSCASLIFIMVAISQAHLIRYGIPAFFGFAVMTAVNLQYVLRLIKSNIIKFFVSSIICSYLLISILENIYDSFQTISASDSTKYVQGKISAQKWLEGRYTVRNPLLVKSNISTNQYFKTKNVFIDKKQPEGILFIGESKTLYLNQFNIADYDMLAKQTLPWIRLVASFNGDHKQISKYLRKIKIGYFYVDLSFYRMPLQLYRYFENRDIWVKNVDRCEPELLAASLYDVAEFLEKYGELIEMNLQKQVYIFRLKQ